MEEFRSVKYLATIKPIVIKENTRIEPDGFGTFTVVNTGDIPLLLNSAITIPAGGRFDVAFEPYVLFGSDLEIAFIGTGTASALVVCVYYKEQ